jgi:GT2 family glycosyltransferase
MTGRVDGPHVAVVILSWNDRDHTLGCLASVARSRYGGRITAVVVDNASSDDTVEAVRGQHPEAELLALPANLGFSEGNNRGLVRALELGVDYAMLVNNDVTVEPEMVAELVAQAKRSPDAGALCPLMHYADRPDTIWYAGATFDAEAGYDARQIGYGERDMGQYSGSVREITRATGAAMLVPRRVLEEVGPLERDLFLYVEDIEWSLRILEAGYRIYLVPRARALHAVSMATGGDEHSPATAYYLARNTLEVCARYARSSGRRSFWRQTKTILAQVLHARRARRPLTNLRAVIEGCRDYFAGRLGPRGATVPSGVRAAPDRARPRARGWSEVGLDDPELLPTPGGSLA